MRDSIKIIENGFVFTGDKNYRCGMLTLLIQGDRILEIGKRADAVKLQYTNAETINAVGKVIFPGFVDAHYHGESFLLRFFTSIYPQTKWTKYASIRRATEYIKSQATLDELTSMYRLAYFSALKSGITTIAEFGLDYLDISLKATFEALQQSELRGFIGLHNGDQFELARTLKSPSIRFAAIVPGEEELTLYNLQSTIRNAREYKAPLIIHLGETHRTFELLKKNFNKSVVQLCNEFHLFESPIHIVNLACFESDDMERLAKSNVPLIISPSAIFQKGVDIPPIVEIEKNTIPITLASDWGLTEPFANMRSYNILQQSLGLDQVKSFDLLKLHTVNGARTLQMDSEVGTIEVGKKADLVFLDAVNIKSQSFMVDEREDLLLNMLLTESTSGDIIDVMIGGEFYVRERHILTYSEEELIRDGKILIQKLLSLSNKNADLLKPTAEILPFTPLISRDTSDPESIPFDEGYKIIRKGEQSEEPSESKKDSQGVKQDLPKDVRRIFGDDDD